jgi:tRNA(fMet)-specific endonuclease VapC
LNKALLDTDIFSEVLKGVDVNVVRNATAYRLAHGVLTISTITVVELVRGLYKKQSQRSLRAFRSAIAVEEVLDFGQSAAELAGQISGELERIGRPIGMADPMIAAVALTRGLELVTGNTAHFQRIQQLSYPLVVTNWRV